MQTKKDFVSGIKRARALYTEARKLATVRPRRNGLGLHKKQSLRVMELAFLGMVAEWESFLEDTLVRYAAGATCPNGAAPVLRGPSTGDLESAYKMILGRATFNPDEDYLMMMWPDQIKKRAGKCMPPTSPYHNIANDRKDELELAAVLRNRIAHGSTRCKRAFKAKIPTCGLAPYQGIKVGNVLEAQVATPHFTGVTLTGKDYFDAFADLYLQLADSIAPEVL